MEGARNGESARVDAWDSARLRSCTGRGPMIPRLQWGRQMTHERCGAQGYDGHDRIQIAVAIYVRERELLRAAWAHKIVQATPRQPSDTFA